MTQFQYKVLEWLKTRKAGCAYVLGRWVWPADIRQNRELARELYWHLNLN